MIDLLSVGIDVQSISKDRGLAFVKGLAGHFGLGAVEIRLAIKGSFDDFSTDKTFFDRVSIGFGIKLKDLRLSFGKPEEEKKDKGSGNEILDGLEELLKDDWVAVPAPDKKSAERKMKTRLSAKKKDKFRFQSGTSQPLKANDAGTLDIQTILRRKRQSRQDGPDSDRSFCDPVYLRQIGIGLKGLENYRAEQRLAGQGATDRLAHRRFSPARV